VRIAELLRWVVEQAGNAGWPAQDLPRPGQCVAALGSNVAGLTCASYLAVAGHAVDVLHCGNSAPAEMAAAQGELEAVRSSSVRLHGGQVPDDVDIRECAAVYLASGKWEGREGSLDQSGGLFRATGADSLSPAAAVAEGRRAALAIDAYLSGQGGRECHAYL
jgi:hypothetical protein